VAWVFFEQHRVGSLTTMKDTNSALLDLFGSGPHRRYGVARFPARFRLGGPSATQALIVSHRQQLTPRSIPWRVRDRQRTFSRPRVEELLPAKHRAHVLMCSMDQPATHLPLTSFLWGWRQRYYLPTSAPWIDGADFEDAIGYLRHNRKGRSQAIEAFELQPSRLLLPLSLLIRQHRFFQVGHSGGPVPAQGEERDQLEDQLQDRNSVDQTALNPIRLPSRHPFRRGTEPAALLHDLRNA